MSFRVLFPALPLSLLAAISSAAETLPEVRLNELMSSNGSSAADPAGEFEDWIELHHAGAEPLDLGGWGLSDDPARPFRWVFPGGTVIEPGGHLLVWASGRDREQVLGTIDLVPAGSDWRYHDSGQNLGNTWRLRNFNDSAWPIGRAPLGYGPLVDYVATTIGFGGNPSNKHITTYFRHDFELESKDGIESLELHLWVDDGAAVHLNGVEVMRENLPAGALTFQTRAPDAVGRQPSWTAVTVPATAVGAGRNVLAVQVHQNAPTSSDLAFDLRLAAKVPQPSLHTNFSLGRNGETVSLTRPDGTLEDRVELPPLARDVSYGRLPAEPAEWRYFSGGTPGGENSGEAFFGILEPPVFSIPPGFHSGNQVLDCGHPDPEAELRFTLDGRPPAAEDPRWEEPLLLAPLNWTTGPLSMIRSTPTEGSARGYGWAAPIGQVPKARVLRVRAERPGWLPSPVVGGTWWIGPAFEGLHSLPVVSLIVDRDDFFGRDRGIYVPGRTYDEGGFGSDFWGRPHANYHQRGAEWERPAHFEFFAPHGGGLLRAGEVFTRIHGGGSRVLPQKSLRLYDRGSGALGHRFFDEREDESFRRLILRNSGQDWYDYGPTMFKDAFLQRLVAHLDFETQAYRPTVMYLNGEYWGIHNMRERIDEHYLARLHGVNPDEVDLLSNNAEVQAGSAADYLDLIQFVTSRPMNDPANYAEVARRMDLESFIDYFITGIFFANTDWPGNNVDYWRVRREFDPAAPRGHDGRWRWVLYDLDFAAQQGNAGRDMIQWLKSPTSGWPRPEWSLTLIQRLWTNPDFVAAFCQRFADHLNTTFDPGRASALASGMEAALEGEIEAHFRRWGRSTSLSQWRANVQRLRTFANQRPDAVWGHLTAHFPTGGTGLLRIRQPQADRGHVRVNSIHLDGALTPGVDGRPAEWTGRGFRGFPLEIEAIPAPGQQFSHWAEDGSTEPLLRLELGMTQEWTPAFSTAPAASLLHYWSFNGGDDPLAVAATAGGAELRLEAAGGTLAVLDSGQGFAGENARLGEAAGRHLRLNLPVGAVLVFALPASGYQPLEFAYEARRSGQGGARHGIDYSLDGGTTWSPLDAWTLPDGPPALRRIPLGDLAGAADNPDFAIRLTLERGIGGEAGNNRIDNVTLDARPLPGTLLPPVVTGHLEALERIAGGEAAWLDLAGLFTAPGGEPLEFSATISNPALAELELDDKGMLEFRPLAHGGGRLLLRARIAGSPGMETEAELAFAIHPAPLALAEGRFWFGEWSPQAAAGEMPPHLIFLQSETSDPGISTPLPHAYHVPEADMAPADLAAGRLELPYQLSARSRITALGEDGVAFLNTGRGRDLGAALTTLDTRGVPALELSWRAATLATNSRSYALRPQYRLSPAEPWLDLRDGEGQVVEYLREPEPGPARTLGPHRLPEEALGRPDLQIRWVHHHVAGDSGPRAELRLDDLSVRIPPDAADRFALWQAAHFAAGDPRAAADFRTADGSPNLLRYALGLGPDDPPARALSAAAAGERALRLTLPAVPADLRIQVQHSADLRDWRDVLYDSADPTAPAPGPDGVLDLPLPPGLDEGFFRLRPQWLEGGE